MIITNLTIPIVSKQLLCQYYCQYYYHYCCYYCCHKYYYYYYYYVYDDCYYYFNCYGCSVELSFIIIMIIMTIVGRQADKSTIHTYGYT